MSVDIRLPNITATTTDGQMAQMQSYMHQLVQQLNWALNTLDGALGGNTSSIVMSNRFKGVSTEESLDIFNSLKDLIIKSADIVEAYEETLTRRFNGKYFAESDFGTYIKNTTNTIKTTSENINETFNKVEAITNEDGTGKLDVYVQETEAYVKRGLLGKDKDGKDVYGVAVGETKDGNYTKYAWFTAGKISFFDANGNEVAYISSQKLYITDAHFLGAVEFEGTAKFKDAVEFEVTVKVGHYSMDTSDGLIFNWID